MSLKQPTPQAFQEFIALAKDSKSTSKELTKGHLSQVPSIFTRLLNSLDAAAILTDIDGFIIDVSYQLTELMHYQLSELKGESLQKLSSELHNKQFFKNNWQLIKNSEEKTTVIELWNQCKKGNLIPVQQTSIRLNTDESDSAHFVHLIQDLSSDISNKCKLQKLAMCDHLTGLPTRMAILQNLRDQIDALVSSEQQCAVIFIDLDGFRKINDVYDHQTGDQLMLAGVQRIHKVIGNLYFGRLGGDEFIIIAPFTEKERLTKLLNKILTKFNEPFSVAGHDLYLGINIGVSIAPNNSSDPEELINQADMALHAIKATEKRLQFYTSDFLKSMQRQLKIEHGLKQAMESEALSVHFQPKYDLSSNKIVGLEALLRWQHSELGTVSPEEFIGIAENAGLIVNISRYVLDVSCRLLKRIEKQHANAVPIAVNISGYHFSQSDVYLDVQEALNTYDLAPELIEIEVTENVLMMDYDNVIAQLSMLKSIGVKISIDDFGTGHSSLERLANLPIDSLKIDRSFVLEMSEKPQKQAIIKAVLSLSEALGLESIAEGIETKSQEHFLRCNKCHFGQGFLFAKPIEEKNVIDALLHHN